MIRVKIHFINRESVKFDLDTDYSFNINNGYVYIYNGDTEEEFYYPLHFISKILKYPVDKSDTK